ncbi:MAG TPA: ribosome recycling factor [Candidatus Krumholzibacteria bacterium]|jgi:ribosome recycling factor|nr:ribosome recycling factor [Candidatus Krumholzibacteria bacterium]
MSAETLLHEAEDHMKKSIEAARRELATVRTGKASPALLDTVRVEYYGSQVPLKQVAGVNAPEPRLLTVQPYDRSLIGEIEKAIRGADLGLNPANDGNVIRVPIPQLTEERRKELVKVVRTMVEHGRVAVRNVRHHTNEKLVRLEKEGELTEDEHKRHAKKVQEMTDGTIRKLDEMLKAKEAEVMEV